MTLSKEDLQAIQTLLEPINTRLDGLDTRLDSSVGQINTRLDDLEENQVIIRRSQLKGEKRLDSLEARLESVEENQALIHRSLLKIENEQLPRISAALDGVVSGTDKNKEQDRRICILEDKVDGHNDRIISLEYVARAK